MWFSLPKEPVGAAEGGYIRVVFKRKDKDITLDMEALSRCTGSVDLILAKEIQCMDAGKGLGSQGCSVGKIATYNTCMYVYMSVSVSVCL